MRTKIKNKNNLIRSTYTPTRKKGRKKKIFLFFPLLIIIIILLVLLYDLISYNKFITTSMDAYTLKINDSTFEPTDLWGKRGFIFKDYKGKDIHTSFPQGTTTNLPKEYSLLNSQGEKVSLEGDLNYLQDDTYTLTLNVGSATYSYNLIIDNDFSVDVDDTNSFPSGFIILNLKDLNPDEQIEIIPSFKTSKTQLPNGAETLVPIAYDNKKGSYSIVVKSQKQEIKTNVEIKEYAFRESHFNVPKSTVSSAAKAPDPAVKKAYETASNTITKEKLFTSLFMEPSTGVTTGDFGDVRYINGAKKPTRFHYGVDYANEEKTPVYSTNEGKVLFSDFLPSTGNTIVIDHGMGLTSYYFHLNASLVNVGDLVSHESQIGLMGTTGYSTGSHLHFEIHSNGIKLNPHLFLENKIVL